MDSSTSSVDITIKIRRFIDVWTDRGYEKGDTQVFWYQLLHDIYGVDTPAEFISFEKRVDGTFSDGYIPSTKVIIEQKSLGIDLNKPERQSDGSMLTPYEQAARYSQKLSYSQRARWIVVSDFKSFEIYDMEKPGNDPFTILLQDLDKQYYLLEFLVKDSSVELQKEQDLSVAAGELIAKLYDALRDEYVDPTSPQSQKSLNILCVRLIFCLFAEDSRLFGNTHGKFYSYLSGYKPAQMRSALIRLFDVLATPYEKRDPYLEEDLSSFPYVNGGLFDDSRVEIPQITPLISDILLNQCCRGFHWNEISPTIFGAIVEDTMNPQTRDPNCPHYTSVENLHKAINPLFFDELVEEYTLALSIVEDAKREQQLLSLQDKLAKIKILDPACGSGNFLTESFLLIRGLENKIVKALVETCGFDPSKVTIKVPIENFYGFEINDFAVSVAKSAMWIAEARTHIDTELILNRKIDFFPLKSLTHIYEINALTEDWKSYILPECINYILGNPPFVGKKSLLPRQREELNTIAGKYIKKRAGNLDYVAGWYLKAAEFIQGYPIRCALVSTVNVTRGEQVNILWPVLLDKFNIKIDFAYQVFKWTSEAKRKVQVHCTIVGFSSKDTVVSDKVLYDSEGNRSIVNNISPYLRAENTNFIKSRKHPICDVPHQKIGNKPIDNNIYIFSRDEMEEFIKDEPSSAKFFRPFWGSEEWLKGKERFILWLDGCSPALLRSMPKCRALIEKVREYRLSLGSLSVELADTPTKMHVTNLPTADFIVTPEVSSENRQYIPMDFVKYDKDGMALYSNLVKITSPATLYHFGILQSRVHMVWTKAFCGYKDRRPRYSTEVVYNNFPWPDNPDNLESKISKAAQEILTIRDKYKDSTIADLYDDVVMPDDLRKAHRNLDRMVLKAYGLDTDTTDDDILTFLCNEYDRITNK